MDLRVLWMTLVLGVGSARAGCAATTPTGGPDMDERLIVAAAAGDEEGIAAALAGGADVDVRDPTGRTPLMVATEARQTEAFRALLASGADVDLQDDKLDNSFLYAGAEGLLDILMLAHEAGGGSAGGGSAIPARCVVRFRWDRQDRP